MAYILFNGVLLKEPIGTAKSDAQGNEYAAADYSSSPTSSNTTGFNVPLAVNEKVADAFSKQFSNATSVIWSPKEDHTSVFFQEEGISTRAIYNKKNRIQCTIKSYHSDQVPQPISRVVEKQGYDKTIIDVTEIKERFTTFVFIKMENETSYMTLRLHPNGELSIYELYNKQVEH